MLTGLLPYRLASRGALPCYEAELESLPSLAATLYVAGAAVARLAKA